MPPPPLMWMCFILTGTIQPYKGSQAKDYNPASGELDILIQNKLLDVWHQERKGKFDQVLAITDGL